MKILNAIKNEIVNFYDFDEDTRNLIIAKLVKVIGSANQEDLIKEIKDDFPQNKHSGIGVIYEAITYHSDTWEDFIISEYKRAFDAASKADNSEEIVGCLDELGFVKNKKYEMARKIVNILESNLTAEKYEIRRGALSLLGAWIEDDNVSKYQTTVLKIQEKLKDDNWKVRYMAELILTDINKLPVSYSRSIFDKLRLYFGNAFD
jgi:hypothetical protein